jgi:hypothetical protein
MLVSSSTLMLATVEIRSGAVQATGIGGLLWGTLLVILGLEGGIDLRIETSILRESWSHSAMRTK